MRIFDQFGVLISTPTSKSITMSSFGKSTPRVLTISLSIATILVVINACSGDEGTAEETSVNCSGVTLTYVSDVGPIIQSSCAKSSCHASGSSNGPGALTTYAQVYASRNEIYNAVSNGSMPKDSRLSTNEKSIIMCWIQNGSANN